MSPLSNEQKLHDLAVAFATAEYNNSLQAERERLDKLKLNKELEKLNYPKGKFELFKAIYQFVIEHFKDRPDLFGD